jgi:hypothetical protein
MQRDVTTAMNVTLVDLLDRVVEHGVVLAGDITISVADIDLIYVGLRVLIASVERLEASQAATTEIRDA